MNAAILNRDFQHPSDGWYHIEPKGLHLNRESNVVQVIDDEAVRAIVNRFNQEAEEPGFPGMLVDHEHFKDDLDKESRAYGWLMQLQNRDDGVYGQVRWTATGKAAVDGGDYRFFSTEYLPRESAILNTATVPKRLRPLRLAGLTLTNAPNNKGARPITNRGIDQGSAGASPYRSHDLPEKEFRQGTGVPLADRTETKRKSMKQVAVRMGLSAEASEESVLEAANKIINRAESAEKSLEPLKLQVAELQATNKTLLEAQVETDLVKYKNRIKPGQEGVIKEQLLKNRAGALALLEGMADVERKEFKPLHNRQGAKTPETKTDETGADEKRVNEAAGLIEDYRLANRCTYDIARNAIRNRKPELFVSTSVEATV